jgi:hypothetical protein
MKSDLYWDIIEMIKNDMDPSYGIVVGTNVQAALDDDLLWVWSDDRRDAAAELFGVGFLYRFYEDDPLCPAQRHLALANEINYAPIGTNSYGVADYIRKVVL